MKIARSAFGRRPFVFALWGLLPAPGWAIDGREVMAKHEEAQRLTSFVAKAVLTTAKADGEKKEKGFTISRKLKADGIHFSSLTRFHSPAEVKNEAILFLENDKGENDILLYLPAYQKVRRIERSQQSASFMGSDFSYSDITTPHVADYVHRLKGEVPCPSDPGTACYRVEAKPASDSIRERTGYSRVDSWVRTDIFMVVRNENFDAADVLVKSVDLSGIEKQPSGKFFVKRIEVKNHRSGGTTALQFSEVKADVKIEDAVFTQQSLAKGGK